MGLVQYDIMRGFVGRKIRWVLALTRFVGEICDDIQQIIY